MNSTDQVESQKLARRTFDLSSFQHSLLRGILFSKLRSLRKGRIEIIDPILGSETFGQEDAPSYLRSQLTIHRICAYSKIALGGSIGAGESYAEGDWDADQLTNLIRVLVLNREILNSLDSGIGALFAPVQKLFHLARRNTVQQAKQNIYAHYDLGNPFFELFLDSSWLYSSAIFKDEQTRITEAQIEKIDRICRKLDLKPSDHLLEIGTGWGSLAIHAAKKYGCKVTTTTISKNQFDFSKERIKKEGLSEQITLLFEDYRHLEGQYDKLASIEMIEAVGLENQGVYFGKCASLLKPEGKFVIQAITIRDQFYEAAKNSVDFIQRYIFPGSGIPSIVSMGSAIKNKSDLRITNIEDIGPHYARTLRTWSEKLNGNKARFFELGYDERLYRLWQFYFSYCEGGFHERSISCVQMEMVKPEYRGA